MGEVNALKNTSLTALGGIITALSVVFMFMSSLIPFMTYVVPAFAGLLLIVTVREVELRWSFYIYIAVSFLSLLVIADKESAVMYSFFFGYYPFVKVLIDEKFSNRVLNKLIKFIVFNLGVVLGYLVIIKVFGIPIEEMDEFGKYTNIILLALGNIVFIFYDILVRNLAMIYDLKWHKRVAKIFKF